MAVYFGFNPPFISDNDGPLDRQEDERLIKNDILQLLFTTPGERVHRPNFGTNLVTSVFEPLDEITLLALQSSLVDALNENEPRLSNPRVTLSKDPDEQLLRIYIYGSLTYNPNVKLELETSILAPGVNSDG